VVLITGAASGIGKACVESFLARGCAVVGIDLNVAIETTSINNNYLGLVCDVTDENALKDMLEMSVRHFGGIDMVVLNAGISLVEKQFLSYLQMSGVRYFQSI